MTRRLPLNSTMRGFAQPAHTTATTSRHMVVAVRAVASAGHCPPRRATAPSSQATRTTDVVRCSQRLTLAYAAPDQNRSSVSRARVRSTGPAGRVLTGNAS